MQMTGLAGRVGFRILGAKSIGLLLPEGRRKKRIMQAWEKNGEQIFETLGRLKGPAMKIGQMLSLQEGILPVEVVNMLRLLQKDSPPVRFSELEATLKNDLPHYKEIFESIDERPYAAASIGQVHRARLHDGREVIVKIQYPGIDRMIEGDLSNLKLLFKLLLSVFVKFDIEPLWAEVKERLLEEIDYKNEAENQKLFARLFHDNPAVIVPRVVDEACAEHVLTTEFTPAMPISEVKKHPPAKRNQWGHILFSALAEQILTDGVVHGDPHSGNFAFLDSQEQGPAVIIYDYGNVKKINTEVREGYIKLARLLLENRPEELAQTLQNFGVHYSDGMPLSDKIITDHFVLFREVFDGTYCFGGDNDLMQALLELGKSYWYESLDITFNPEILFVQRALAGTVLNLNILGSCNNYGAILADHTGT